MYSKVVPIQRIRCTQVSDTGPYSHLVLILSLGGSNRFHYDFTDHQKPISYEMPDHFQSLMLRTGRQSVVYKDGLIIGVLFNNIRDMSRDMTKPTK